MCEINLDQITFRTGNDLDLEAVRSVYVESGLAERRPVHDPERFTRMIANADLIITAWHSDELVGFARCLTDWVYVTYLSDLAVKLKWQRLGIGSELIRKTRAVCHPKAMLLLLAAPAAVRYYRHIGFEHHPQAWMIPGEN